MIALHRRKIPSRQRPPNEVFASLPRSLGARLVRRGHSYFLKLERNEQTIAHPNPALVVRPVRSAHQTRARLRDRGLARI